MLEYVFKKTRNNETCCIRLNNFNKEMIWYKMDETGYISNNKDKASYIVYSPKRKELYSHYYKNTILVESKISRI